MRPSPGHQTGPHIVLAELVDELCEAHLDTIELATADDLGAHWRRHLDYLQALQRETRALLARAA